MGARQSGRLKRLFWSATRPRLGERLAIPGEPRRNSVAGYAVRNAGYVLTSEQIRDIETADLAPYRGSLQWPVVLWP